MLFLALAGLLPAFTIAASAEPNRMAAAWPALCALAGLGLAWIAARPGFGLPLMAGLLLAGMGREAAGVKASMEAAGPRWYAESAAVRRLAAAYPKRRLVNELGDEYAAAWRLLWGSRPGSAPPVFVIPEGYAPGLGGFRSALKREGPLSYLDAAPEPLARRLLNVDSGLKSLRSSLPRFALRRRRDGLAEFLAREAGADPWLRTAVLEEALRLSSSLGELRPELVAVAFREPLVSASAPLWLAQKARESGDNAFADKLCARALRIDSSRPCLMLK
jgi:hypothetical protein